jgi:BASS family bile acid:Na+ symporter
MVEFLTSVFPIVVLVQLVGTMLSSGLSLTPIQIVGPFRSVRLTVSAVVGNYILVPLIAVLLARLFGLDQPIRYGLVLLSMVAGAESIPLLSMNAKANVGLAVGLLVTSMVINIFYLPFMLSMFLKDVHIDKIQLLVRLILTVALPVTIGLVVKALYGKTAAFLAKIVRKVANLAMALTVVLIFYLNYKNILSLFGTRAIGVAIIYVVVTFLLGYVLGGPERGNRAPMGFWLGARNASLSIFLATTLFAGERQVLVMASVTIIIMIALALPTSFMLGRRAGQKTAKQG